MRSMRRQAQPALSASTAPPASAVGGVSRSALAQSQEMAQLAAATSETAQAPSGPNPVDRALSGGGGTLPYREEMEQRFGQDFSGVRAYVGRDRALVRVGAEALARGESVAFRSSSPSRSLVAHELVHVVQSRRAARGEASVSSTARLEGEADRLGGRSAGHAPIAVQGAAGAGAVLLVAPDSALGRRIAEAVVEEMQNRPGGEYAENWELRSIDGPHRMANPDPNLTDDLAAQQRFQCRFYEEINDEYKDISVNYGSATGQFGIIKFASGR